MKKFICSILAMILVLGISFSCSAAVLDGEYAPEKYTNISGNFSAKDLSQETNIFKINLSAEQMVVVLLTPADPQEKISVGISDAEDKLCSKTDSADSGNIGQILCAYKSAQGGTYYVNVSGDSSFSYNIDITLLSAQKSIENQFPYSAYLQEGVSNSGYMLYSFPLIAGDAFSLKTDLNYSYILFSGGTSVIGKATHLYSNEFYGYCSTVADSCVATVIIPYPATGKIEANTLEHNKYIYEDVYLPLKSKNLNMQDAMPPFEQEELDAFTADFGQDSIDNSPIKFFSFSGRMNQILQFSATNDVFSTCSIVYSPGEANNPSFGSGHVEQLNTYKGEDTLMHTNVLLHATGKYMLAARGDNDVEVDLEIFEAFATTTKLKPTYSYGESPGKIEIKNLFVDTNFKDDEGKIAIPRVSCFKLIDQKGNKYFYPPAEAIRPSAGNSYSLFAVITDGHITYQVFLGSFKAEKAALPQGEQTNLDSAPNAPVSVTWWMVVLMIIGGFCLACVVFLLVYKKDMNEIE